jgi:hypothetical protein
MHFSDLYRADARARELAPQLVAATARAVEHA